MSVEFSEFRMEVIPDSDADVSYLYQEGLFEDRRVAYERGEFGFVGVRAACDMLIPYGKDYITSTIESPGLWGIENDSGDDYFKSVFDDESVTLREMIAAVTTSPV